LVMVVVMAMVAVMVGWLVEWGAGKKTIYNNSRSTAPWRRYW
jgi:hypothetical protein